MQDKTNDAREFIKFYFDEFNRFYFVVAVALTVAAFFSPPFAALLVIGLLTGSIWVFLDACGGVSHSLDFLRNRNYKNPEDENYTLRNIHLVNIAWCFLMGLFAVGSFLLGGSPFWISLLFASFGCAMWIYIIDNMNRDDWNNPDKAQTLRIDSLAWALGGLGAIFLACFIGFNLPFGVGLVGVICYAFAAVLKLGQFIYNMYQAHTPAEANISDLQVTDANLEQKASLLKSHKHDIDHAPKARGNTLFENNLPQNMEVSSDLSANTNSFVIVAKNNVDCSKGLESLFEFITSIWRHVHKESNNVVTSSTGVSCFSNSSGDFDDADIQDLMASSALKFKLNPIVISGGDNCAQLRAVKAALNLGFTNIILKDVTNKGFSAEYSKIIELLESIRKNYNQHESTLAELAAAPSKAQFSQIIMNNLTKCLNEQEAVTLNNFMLLDINKMKLMV